MKSLQALCRKLWSYNKIIPMSILNHDIFFFWLCLLRFLCLLLFTFYILSFSSKAEGGSSSNSYDPKGGITSQNWRGTCISVYFVGLRVFLCPLRLRVFWLVWGLLLGLIFSVESAAAQPIGGDIVMATSEPSVNQSPATSEPSVNQALPSVKQAPATSEPSVNQALPSDVAKETGKGSGCCSSLFGCLCSCGCKHLCF